MKVVLFCGGLGMRLRDYSENIPKPMVNIGYRPILWHVMKYYAHHGHKDFILCLGYKADAIKRYFLDYDECITNDFVLSNGGKDLKLLNSDVQDWKLTFVDTGANSNIGQRLKAVEDHLKGEQVFLANYADGLTDLPLSDHVQKFLASRKVASFVCVKPSQTFHVAALDGDGDVVSGLEHVTKTGLWMNGGYFAFRHEIFNYMRDGEELVEQPFQRLISEKQLIGYRYDGFWACMDTFKELQTLEDLYNRNEAPWEVWKGKRRNGNRNAQP
jgi:glucose-1-phosphate cytidylyltransferase